MQATCWLFLLGLHSLLKLPQLLHFVHHVIFITIRAELHHVNRHPKFQLLQCLFNACLQEFEQTDTRFYALPNSCTGTTIGSLAICTSEQLISSASSPSLIWMIDGCLPGAWTLDTLSRVFIQIVIALST
jgi:hypothetical protein